MTINKEFIQNFNKSKSLESYREVYSSLIIEKHECRVCDDVIYYYDSTFKISQKTKQLEPLGKSFKSKKTVDGKDYYLTVCEKCLTNKFPEYSKKNKTRVFNGMNEITKFAFSIPEEVASKWINKNYSITEKTLIEKYGEVEGKERWKSYCEKQAYSNTFEFKKEKWGWTEEEFKEYNKSRSVTLENLIKRHGFESGEKIWRDYCERQRFTTTKDYFLEKYGEKIGLEKYDNFCNKRLFSGGSYSNISQSIFQILQNKFKELTLFFGENEYYFKDKENSRFYLLDFYIKELSFGIEFQGDLWHANPNKYKENDVPIKFDKKQLTAKEIWERDRLKQEFLKTKIKKLIIIWESDIVKRGLDSIVEEILNEINLIK
jgi:hypothetical protein